MMCLPIFKYQALNCNPALGTNLCTRYTMGPMLIGALALQCVHLNLIVDMIPTVTLVCMTQLSAILEV